MRCNRNHNHNKFHAKANLTQHEKFVSPAQGGRRLKLPFEADSQAARQSVSHKSLSYLPPYCYCYTYRATSQHPAALPLWHLPRNNQDFRLSLRFGCGVRCEHPQQTFKMNALTRFVAVHGLNLPQLSIIRQKHGSTTLDQNKTNPVNVNMRTCVKLRSCQPEENLKLFKIPLNINIKGISRYPQCKSSCTAFEKMYYIVSNSVQNHLILIWNVILFMIRPQISVRIKKLGTQIFRMLRLTCCLFHRPERPI